MERYITERKTSRDVKRGKSPTKSLETTQKTDAKRVTENQSNYTRKPSTERKVPETRTYQHTDITDSKERRERLSEYKTSHTYQERRSSSDQTTTVTRRSQSPETKPQRRVSPEKDRPDRRSPQKEKPKQPSPERKTVTSTETKQFTQLKKTSTNDWRQTKKPSDDGKPDWVKQRNLRKTSETAAPVSTRKATSSNTTRVTTKETRRSSSPMKETRPTDIITSSYGVGPTDENGTPLFGLRALRAQNKTDTTKGNLFNIHVLLRTEPCPFGRWRSLLYNL